MQNQEKVNIFEELTENLYIYEAITFELFEFLETQKKLTRTSNRIAYESEILYRNKSLQIQFLFEISWSSTYIDIAQKSIIFWNSNRVKNFKDVEISKSSKEWIAQNRNSVTSRILKDELISNQMKNEVLKSRIRELLNLREKIISNEIKI
ncbi:MAG TPA: hypothetical protein PLD62_00335 [Candidatus Cloacimonadota bacterium]|nr:hypothetical protein [Candidatus Cloacimonadota bacterium]